MKSDKLIIMLTATWALLAALPALADSDVPTASAPAQGTVTISRDEFEALKARLDDMQKQIDNLKAGKSATTPETVPEATEAARAAPETETANAPSGGRHLALPDISLIGQAKGKLSSDKRDLLRNRIRLSELELGIQGYVYPNVKADAFITMSPQEHASAQVEEAYLSYISLMKGFDLNIGEKHVPFGRTNLLHNHSWLYVNQPLVLRNLVAEESLGGEGANASYVLPLKSKLFAQLDVGEWTGESQGGPDESNPPDIVAGSVPAFTRQFYTTRLWTGYPASENTEVELGGSYAKGGSELSGITGNARLEGTDLTYRHFGKGQERLLVRGEQVWRTETSPGPDHTAQGYYLFANYRKDIYSSLGLRWDQSQFPQVEAAGRRETAMSLIYTRQFSEQYYVRLQATHGSRPGPELNNQLYNELWLQWVWGVGPHTHNLE